MKMILLKSGMIFE